MRVDLDIKDIHIGKALEQNRLAFHDRLAGKGADIAQAQHGRAVGDDSHEIAAVGIPAGKLRVFLYYKAGLGNAGGIGKGQVLLRFAVFGRHNFYFSRHGKFVIA